MKEIIINPRKAFEFDLKAVEACRQCKRFGNKASCPPHTPDIDYYEDLLPTYNKGIIYYKNYKITNVTDWTKLGKESSLDLHKFLLDKRASLISQGKYFVTAFIGGSCKLCDTCQFPCIKPGQSLVPLEATGIDVVKLMAKENVIIKFPVKTSFYRVGLLLWD